MHASQQDTLPTSSSGDAVHVARQPIYTRALDVYAYELLFRTQDRRCDIESGDAATGEVMVSSLMDIGVSRLVGEALAFINLTEAYITGEYPLPPLGDRVVLEVLENVEPTPQVVAGIQRLKDEGYRIALDDFVFTPAHTPLVELADIVKLDVLEHDPDSLAAQVALLRKHNVALLAEKVESHEQHRACMALGFDFFQGYFFCKPDIVSGKRPAGNRLIATQLLSALQRPDIEFDELQAILARDATLAYRLLTYVNSAYFNLRSEVSSIRHALTIVGTRGVRQWAMLVLMMTLKQGKPGELLRIGMMRARMCEALAARSPSVSADTLFTCGLFSILDALMDRPMPELVDTLAIDDDVVLALTEGSGPLGATLSAVVAYEHGDDQHLDEAWQRDLQRAYLDALASTREFDRIAGTDAD